MLSIDQLSKAMMLRYLSDGGTGKIFPGLSFSLYFNKGVAFSMLGRYEIQNAIILISLALLVFLVFSRPVARMSIGWPIMFAGAVGNTIDRFAHGYVIDWIHFGLYLNLADIFLILGSSIIILTKLREKYGAKCTKN